MSSKWRLKPWYSTPFWGPFIRCDRESAQNIDRSIFHTKAPFRRHKTKYVPEFVPEFIPEFVPEFVPEFDLNTDFYSGTNSGTNSGMNSGTNFFYVV